MSLAVFHLAFLQFIYQFQTFHLFRNKVADLSAEEVAMLREHEHMWSAQTVIQYMHALVRKAGIDLNKKAAEQDESPDSKSASVCPMFKTLGYFGLIGLLRVNALLCDYPSALQSLAPLDLRKHRSVFTSVLSCHVSLYYYMGLSYLMCRRYVDAIKVRIRATTKLQKAKHSGAMSSEALHFVRPLTFLPLCLSPLCSALGVLLLPDVHSAQQARDFSFEPG